MVNLFLLIVIVWIFLGLVGEVDSPPIVFTPALWRGFCLTIGFVYFYKVSFQHLGLFGENLRNMLCYKGFYF